MTPGWLWIPVTVWAAFAQTVRNAAQRGLTSSLGTLGATLVRFLYGLPFALLWLGLVLAWTGSRIPPLTLVFWTWVVFGGLAQIAAMALLLRTMQDRNFALAVAYSKSEVVQVAVFGLVLLGDAITFGLALAVTAGTLGVLLLSPADREHPIRGLLAGWTSRTALAGIGSGAGFALSAVAYRAATFTFETTPFATSAAVTLAAAMAVQTVMLGGWIALRDPPLVRRVLAAWRPSLFAGFMGAAASAGWFTAFAIQTVGHVRTLGLVELVFSLAISRKLFGERHTRAELAGMALLALGVALATLD